MGKRNYIFDKNLKFRLAERTLFRKVKTVLKYFIATVSLSVVYYLIFALVISTDSQKELRRENRLYEKTYVDMVNRERLIGDVVSGLQLKDGQIYEEVFHAQAPSLDHLGQQSYLSAVDTIASKDIVDYTYGKTTKAEVASAKVEQNFRKILSMTEKMYGSLPPMSLPLESVSFAQTGASVGSKVNPFYKVETQHNGLDLIAPQGDAVLAVADGVVSSVDHSRKGSGNVVEIAHAEGYVTRYAHLGDITVSKGQRVVRGKKIGEVGISGNSFAPHLHYEVLKDGVNLDPVDFFFASLSPEEYADMKFMATRTGQSLD